MEAQHHSPTVQCLAIPWIQLMKMVKLFCRLNKCHATAAQFPHVNSAQRSVGSARFGWTEFRSAQWRSVLLMMLVMGQMAAAVTAEAVKSACKVQIISGASGVYRRTSQGHSHTFSCICFWIALNNLHFIFLCLNHCCSLPLMLRLV